MIHVTFGYAELEYFLLILTRVTCFVYISPFFSTRNTPNMVRIAFSLFLAYLVSSYLPHTALAYDTLTGYIVMIMKEAVTGFLIGFGASLCMTVISFAGRIIDMEIGLMMASVMDPMTEENTSITGVMYSNAITLILLVSGMYQFLLLALVETFTLIPINGAIFRPEALVTSLTTFLREYIILGFRIALPVFVVITLLNAMLGVLAKVAPQMNMFAVGMQMKLLLGFSIVYLTVGMLPIAATIIFEQTKRVVTAMVRIMI